MLDANNNSTCDVNKILKSVPDKKHLETDSYHSGSHLEPLSGQATSVQPGIRRALSLCGYHALIAFLHACWATTKSMRRCQLLSAAAAVDVVAAATAAAAEADAVVWQLS